MLSCCNTFLSTLELIWLISRLKMSKLFKKLAFSCSDVLVYIDLKQKLVALKLVYLEGAYCKSSN